MVSIKHIDRQIELPEILLRIAKCESGGKQFNANGSVLRGKINPQDIGKFQINLIYHGETAKKMGLDLFTEQGNTLYALYLYRKNRTRDWNWSKSCWNK
ncbi:MAG: hypothetical protein AAB706_02085 [Patescibacteria group bacterium]